MVERLGVFFKGSQETFGGMLRCLNFPQVCEVLVYTANDIYGSWLGGFLVSVASACSLDNAVHSGRKTDNAAKGDVNPSFYDLGGDTDYQLLWVAKCGIHLFQCRAAMSHAHGSGKVITAGKAVR